MARNRRSRGTDSGRRRHQLAFRCITIWGLIGRVAYGCCTMETPLCVDVASGRFSPGRKRWLQAFHKHRGNHCRPLPNFCLRTVRAKKLPTRISKGVDLSSWRAALNGRGARSIPENSRAVRTAICPNTVFSAVEAQLPVYGLAEASLAVTFSANQSRTTLWITSIATFSPRQGRSPFPRPKTQIQLRSSLPAKACCES